jgi:cell division protein FtsL
MHSWFSSRGIILSGIVDFIPLAATVISCLLSVVLARATLRYAEAADKGLALARDEFEREWSPELHLKLERVSATEARIVVTNLAKISVLLQMMQLRKISHAVPFERTFLNDPLVGGMTWAQDVGKRLITCTGQDYEGLVAASMNFYCSGRMFRTDWFRFYIQVRNGHIIRMGPTNTPARRVRVLENYKGPERRKRQHAQDITKDVLGIKREEVPV